MSERSLTYDTVHDVIQDFSQQEQPAHRKRAPSMSVDERREAILRAVGPHVVNAQMKLSTRELAQYAGVAEGTLFRVFKDKQDLLQQAFHSELERMIEDDAWEKRLAKVQSSTDVQDRVEACLTVLLELFDDWSAIIITMRQTMLTQQHQHRYNASHHDEQATHATDHTSMAQLYQRLMLRVNQELQHQLQPVADQLSVPVEQAAAFIHMMMTAQSLATLHHQNTGLTTHQLARTIVHGIAR
ncbi:hypothetical protein GCM10007377_06170 [Galliscardovia ingluviei]|uniref:HTH tetR-type domain-containing protein n=1 Tax=Galliscardovia ingluviei TaxID=1769422 RepID=A0A8J3AGL4_9BIFI|nr:hypothetical protein GCM10007377_06170 [Galliscardovia ingluviei]